MRMTLVGVERVLPSLMSYALYRTSSIAFILPAVWRGACKFGHFSHGSCQSSRRIGVEILTTGLVQRRSEQNSDGDLMVFAYWSTASKTDSERNIGVCIGMAFVVRGNDTIDCDYELSKLRL